jgi:hypothetical protein
MDKTTDERVETYEEPRIEDLGTLAELTADKNFSGGDFPLFFLGPVS